MIALASQAMVFQAFMLMHTMRTSTGFGVNPLTLQDLNAYEDRFGRLPIDGDLLIRVIKQLDEVALAWISKKMAEKTKTATT